MADRMTKQEALEILDWIPTKGDEVDAMEMAIEALQKDCDDYITIKRQFVLDAIDIGLCGYMTDDDKLTLDGMAIVVSELPSAQPELCEDAVSRQRLLSDLKELIAAWKKYPIMAERIKGVEAAIGYVKVIPSVKPDSKELSSTHKALDTISRQAAIDVLKVAYWDNDIQSAKDDPCIVDAMTDWAIRQVKALPSAEPEPLDDGTLMMTVPNGMLNDVKRVLVDEVGTKNCKVMYQDAKGEGEE